MKRSRLLLTITCVAALLAAVGFGALSGAPQVVQAPVAQVTPQAARPILPQPQVPECPEALGANPMGGPCIPRALRNAPPDPGPENDQTLAGIDSNGNGVRDDVERYIAANFAESPAKIVYLLQHARATSAFSAIEMTSPAQALSYARERARANSCAAALIGPADRPFTTAEMRQLNAFFDAAQDVTLQHLNTPPRLAAFAKNERLLAGQGMTLDNPQPAERACDFLSPNPSTPTHGERK